MKKFAAAALATVFLATSPVPFIEPANAQDRSYSRADRDRYIGRFCANRPNHPDCRDWRSNRSRWDDRRYRDWYHQTHRGSSGSNAAAAAIFGLAAGALLSGAYTGGFGGFSAGGGRDVTAHVRACQARYRSYDPSTNTFMGYDGIRRPCRL
jgi:hypothetical protein